MNDWIFKGGLWTLLLLIPVFASIPVIAAEPSSAPPVEERAVEILQNAAGYLSKTKQFKFRAEATFDMVQGSGQKLQFSARLKVSARRPDRISVSLERDDGTRRGVWYDGKNVTILEMSENVYGTIPVPGNIDGMLDYLDEEVAARVPLADLLYSDLSFLWTLAESGIFVGETFVDGVLCDQLAFRNKTLDWQLWIEKGTKPLFRKVVLTYKDKAGQPQFAAFLDQWDLAPELPDSLFEFSPPKGAEKIRFLSVAPPHGGREEKPK